MVARRQTCVWNINIYIRKRISGWKAPWEKKGSRINSVSPINNLEQNSPPTLHHIHSIEQFDSQMKNHCKQINELNSKEGRGRLIGTSVTLGFWKFPVSISMSLPRIAGLEYPYFRLSKRLTCITEKNNVIRSSAKDICTLTTRHSHHCMQNTCTFG